VQAVDEVTETTAQRPILVLVAVAQFLLLELLIQVPAEVLAERVLLVQVVAE
jgi:hypothetical protein